MRNALAWLILLLTASPVAWAAQARLVDAEAVSQRVLAHLRETSAGLPGELELAVLGRVDGGRLPPGQHSLRIADLTGRWPRPRVAVNVEHWVDGRKVRTQAVWVAVRWWAEADVHAGNEAAGTPLDGLAFRRDRVDLAPYGPALDVSTLGADQRLSRPVRAGRPVQAADFEATPDVVAGSELQVEVARGAVRLKTSGRALADGFVGEVIPVALANSRQPVETVILTSQAVRVEE